jgi:geranylgeranyl transferase type-2 subunit alpha
MVYYLYVAIIIKRSEKIYTPESLDQTRQIMRMNPDFYTLWNFRKTAIKHLVDTELNSEQSQTLFVSEIAFTDECLQLQPKSYYVWYHRQWCLRGMPQPTWTREIKLLNKMLSLDPRNS